MAGGSWEVYKDSDGWVKLMYSREGRLGENTYTQ